MFISPALVAKGWQVPTNMREEYYFTAGRILVYGKEHSQEKGKKADYLLFHKGKPIAVVEAKDNVHALGAGMQQAIDYARILDLKFAYSSNGDGFLEHDGKRERPCSLTQCYYSGNLRYSWKKYWFVAEDGQVPTT